MRRVGIRSGRFPFAFLLYAAALLLGAASRLVGSCGPFTDVAADAFCPYVLEIFTLGLTTGTTPTTYDPAGNVTRLQMAAFLSRSVDAVARRGSRRALARRFWTPQSGAVLGITTVGNAAVMPAFDGLDVWVPNLNDATVSRVRGSDGGVLGTWSGAAGAWAAVPAIGKVFVAGQTWPGTLYRIDPRQPPGPATTVAGNLGNAPFHLAFDGARFWTPNVGGVASVSIVTVGTSIPWTVTTVTAGFSGPAGVVFDGGNVWLADNVAGTLLRLNSTGAVLQTVTVGSSPLFPGFDGANLWVPNNYSASVSVVRASTGAVLATLTGNGLTSPFQAAFDGERVLVVSGSGDVSFWKAADLTAVGNFSMGGSSSPNGACSDGIGFWITIRGNQLARF